MFSRVAPCHPWNLAKTGLKRQHCVTLLNLSILLKYPSLYVSMGVCRGGGVYVGVCLEVSS